VPADRATPGQPRTVLPDPPQPRRLRRIGHHPGIQRTRRRDHVGPPSGQLTEVVAAQLQEQPTLPARQLGYRPGTSPGHQRLHDPRVQSLQRNGFERKQGRDGVSGDGHVRVAERDQHGSGRRLDQPDGCPEHDPAGALGTDQHLRHVEPALGQQMLQGVAGHLAGEPAELGPDGAEVGPGQLVQPRHHRGRRGVGASSQREPLPVAAQQVQRDHVVRGPAVGEGPRPAGVVADHPAEGGPVLGGRVGAEPQPVRRRGPLQGGEHHSRLHHGGARLRVETEDGAQVPAQVHHHPRADRVAGHGGARTADGQRGAELPADPQ
jgi:hypothetical protein